MTGGNMHLVSWLLDEQGVPLTTDSGEPLTTTYGLTPLALAAIYGHGEILSYLVNKHNCKVTDISEQTTLHNALHLALKAPGPLPFPIPCSDNTATADLADLDNGKLLVLLLLVH